MNVIGGLTYSVTSTRNTGITARTADGSSVINFSTSSSLTFTPTYSGQARIVNCSSQSATMTISVSGGSNSVDAQTNAGTNAWVEHFYKRLDATAGAPSDANAFGRYLGTSLSGQTETFSSTFGGGDDVTCNPVYSQSTQRSTYLNSYFAVRYRMNSTKAKGVYLADMAADDGVRLTVDGTLVFNRWQEQGVTSYTKEIFALTGTSSLLLEYYESGGANELSFTNFSRVSNTISTADQTICFGGSITALSATNTLTAAPISSDARFTITYQWQQSTDNVNFTNISGATSQNYTPTVTAAGVYYFRRIANVSRTNDGMPSAFNLPDESNSVKVTIMATPVVTITGGTSVCQNATAPNLTFTNPQTTAITVIYKINGGTNQTVNIPASSSTNVSVATGTAGTFSYVANSVAYQTAPNCTNTGISASASVIVRPLPNGTLSSGASPVCQGTQVQLRFTSSAGTGPFSLVINGTTYNSITSGTLFNVTPNINSTTTFNLTKITDANTCVLQNP
ncbi:hypothetical protein [Edaphocola flava]|uniref:hypothetical protein n=1 Tax=Edaphocola flava TaxID=2499629 RepID=UPI0013867810|nr:hypothetical protein [Edaphocola flava]